MKTYKFKPEFEKKLKGVKRKFIYNWNNYKGENRTSFEELDKEINFRQFILASFIWDLTPEGGIFWVDVSER